MATVHALSQILLKNHLTHNDLKLIWIHRVRQGILKEKSDLSKLSEVLQRVNEQISCSNWVDTHGTGNNKNAIKFPISN